MQTVAGDELAVQIHTGVAVQGIDRGGEVSYGELRAAYIYTARIVGIAAHVHQHVGLYGARGYIKAHGGECKMNVAQIAVRHLKRQGRRRLFDSGSLSHGIFLGAAQVDAYPGIV